MILHVHVHVTGLFIKPSNITGYLTVCHIHVHIVVHSGTMSALQTLQKIISFLREYRNPGKKRDPAGD